MPKKNPRKPAGAPDHHRGQPTFQQATPPTPPVSGYSPGRAEPGPSYYDQPFGGATLDFAAAADDVDDDNFMSAGVVDPNDVLPSPGPYFCNLSLREGGEPSTSRLTTRPTFTQQDLGIVDHAAREAADPLSYEGRFPGPSTYERTYELGYSRTDVYCPSYSDVTASEALGYTSYSASGCQAEGIAVQLSTYGSHPSAVSDEISELPGTSESLYPYGDAAGPGGGSSSGGCQKPHVQSTSEESDAPSSSASASKKGSYKHRHCRLYGLSEEEKMQRNKTLNNEATQLYRERKRKRQTEIEDDLTKEEEKKRELLQQKLELQKKIEKYRKLRKALGKGDDRDPPGDGNLFM